VRSMPPSEDAEELRVTLEDIDTRERLPRRRGF
jgi:hypothetical protein